MPHSPVIELHPTQHAFDRADQIHAGETSFDEILTRRYILRPNRPGRGGSHLVIGRNDRGDCLVIPVERGHYASEWVAITIWRCDASEETALGR